MNVLTQHMVYSMPGTEELVHKTGEILHDTSFVIQPLDNGFQAHVEGLPFFFTVSCFEDIGWNVFLTSVNGSIDDDEQTDSYYHAIEEAVGMVNETYFSEDEENDMVSYNLFKLQAMTESTVGDVGTFEVVEDTARHILKVGLGKDEPIEIGYSKLFRRWYYEIKNKESVQQLFTQPRVRHYLEEVDYLIENFNHSM